MDEPTRIDMYASGRITKLTGQLSRLRSAIVRMLGYDGRAELRWVRVTLSTNPKMDENERKAALALIDALLETLPEEMSRG